MLLFPAFAAAVGTHSSIFWRLGTEVWIYTFPDESECGIWIQTLKPNLKRTPLCTALNFEFKSFKTTEVEARRQSLFAPRWVQKGQLLGRKTSCQSRLQEPTWQEKRVDSKRALLHQAVLPLRIRSVNIGIRQNHLIIRAFSYLPPTADR